MTLDIEEFADRDLVIEAAPEIEALKFEIFGKLDKIVKPSGILATNTSSIPVIKIANATQRPSQVVGVHFFNPVPVMPLVEIVVSLVTSEETVAAVTEFARDTLGKKAVRAGDRAGFIVNALLIPYLCDAVRMLESGYASAEDIDEAMKGGCGYPMGPLTLLDTVGLDVALAAAESLYAEFAQPNYAPPPCSAARSTPDTWVARPARASTATSNATDLSVPHRLPRRWGTVVHARVRAGARAWTTFGPHPGRGCGPNAVRRRIRRGTERSARRSGPGSHRCHRRRCRCR